MAFANTTEWDVRTTGSDANGGGWDTASTGTDRSQQDAAFQAYTDIVIDGVTNTKITSAAHPFDSTSPGNLINITAGTGFTVQRVQIVSVAAGVATCDKAVGTISSTGGTGNLGGSLLTINKACGLLAATGAGTPYKGNTVHVKAGTYTETLVVSADNFLLIGYGTTHNDGGTKPLLTTAANTILIAINGTLAVANSLISNMSFSSTAGTRNDGINPNSGATGNIGLFVLNCIFDGFRYAYFGDNGARGLVPFLWFGNVEIKNCTTGGIYSVGTAITVYDSYLHNNTGTAIGSNGQIVNVSNTILAVNTIGVGGTGTPRLYLRNCTIASNTGDGIDASTLPLAMENCIVYGNGGWGVNFTIAPSAYGLNRNNAYGSNTSGNRNNWFVGVSDVALSAGPFTNSGAGDYSLNSTAGGGTACKGAGFPGLFPGGTSTGSPDIGAVQTAAGGGGGTTTYVFAPNITNFINEGGT